MTGCAIRYTFLMFLSFRFLILLGCQREPPGSPTGTGEFVSVTVRKSHNRKLWKAGEAVEGHECVVCVG